MTILVRPLDKTADKGSDLRVILNQVVVIENQCEMITDRFVDLIDQDSNELVYIQSLSGYVLQPGYGGRTKARKLMTDGSNQMSENLREADVLPVQGVPANDQVGLMSEIYQEGSFSVACGCDNENEFVF